MLLPGKISDAEYRDCGILYGAKHSEEKSRKKPVLIA